MSSEQLSWHLPGKWCAERGRESFSAFDDVVPLREHVADTLAKVTLELDAIVGRRAAGAAGAFQLLAQLLEKPGILWEAVDHGHRLAAATLLLHSELGDDARRNGGLDSAPSAALAIALRPSAHRAFAVRLGGIHEARVGFDAHHLIMALTATIYNFDVELADTDRHVYESLALRVARHPSESEEYLVARVIAYLLEFATGIEFSRGGVSSPDEPTIAIRDLTGALTAWIDIGTPDAERLHKAAKLAGRVAVYTHKEPAQFLKQLAGRKIHNAPALELYAIDRGLIDSLVARLERRVGFSVSVTDRELYVTIGAHTITGAVVRLTQ